MKAIQKVHAFNSQLNFPLKKESTQQLPKKYVGGQSVYNPINHESFHEGRVGNGVCSNGQAKEREKGRDFWLSKVDKKEILNDLHQIQLKEELPKMCTRISNSGQFIRL